MPLKTQFILLITLLIGSSLADQSALAQTVPGMGKSRVDDSRNKSVLVQLFKRIFGQGGRTPDPPSDRQRGQDTQDRCPPTDSRLAALIPLGSDGLPTGKTLAAHPTLWFYVPYAEQFPEQTDRRLELVLIDQDENILYRNTFLLPQQPGIVSVSLPSTQPGLVVNNRYRWVFSVICNPQNRSGDATVNGWIERVSIRSDLQQQLEKQSDPERLKLYAEQALWYETLRTLMQMRQSNPPTANVEEDWKGLLEAIGLPDLAAQPFVPAAQCAICRGEADPINSPLDSFPANAPER